MAMRAQTPVKKTSRKRKRGFTLIEIIIAMTLFAIIAALGTTFFIQVSRIYKRVTLQNELLNETEFVMERLRQTIGENTLDYEEYYNQAQNGPGAEYGYKYGSDTDYGAQFYDSTTGRATGTGPDGISIDSNCTTPDGNSTTTGYPQCQLYLINAAGDHKIIFAREETGTDESTDATKYAIAIAEMDGTDESTVDGIPDTWTCSSDFTSCAGTPPSAADFIPITPSNMTITSLTFYVSPLKDPRKAFAEKDAEVVIQPHVTIVLTAQLTDEAALGTYGITPEIQLETTVSSRVYNEVTSYVNNS